MYDNNFYAHYVSSAQITYITTVTTTLTINLIIIKVDGAMSFAPVIDGVFLTCAITHCLTDGTFNKNIPALFGSNAGDGATFVYYIDEPIPYKAYQAAVEVRGVWMRCRGNNDG